MSAESDAAIARLSTVTDAIIAEVAALKAQPNQAAADLATMVTAVNAESAKLEANVPPVAPQG